MRGSHGKRKAALCGAIAIALVSAACNKSTPAPQPSAAAGGSAQAVAPATLNVELDWVPNPDHVGIYYAQDKGMFTDANLTVNLRSPSNAADPIKLIGLNKVDLAISYESEMFYGQEKGLHVTAVATVVPVPLNSLIASASSGITTLADVKGKNVGVTGIPSDDAFFLTMLKTAGLSENDVTKTNVGYNLVTSLLSGKVDAIIGGYTNVEAIQIAQESGSQPTVLPADQLGVPSYAELVLVANADRLKSDAAYADAVKRFVAALVAGTDAARKDPTGATAIMQKATQYKPEFLQESIPTTLDLLAPAAGSKTGCIDIANWQSFGDWMKQQALIKSTPDAAAISTDSYLPYACS